MAMNMATQIRKPFNVEGNSYLPHLGQNTWSLSISTVTIALSSIPFFLVVADQVIWNTDS